MLSWLSSECTELQDELRLVNNNITYNDGYNNNNNIIISINPSVKKRIISELGDVLFDALMLEMICRREFGFGKEDAWEAAYLKVERRTPYMGAWSDGKTTANTPEEAKEIWQMIKKQEKQEEYWKSHIYASGRRKLTDQVDWKRQIIQTSRDAARYIIPVTFGAIVGYIFGMNALYIRTCASE